MHHTKGDAYATVSRLDERSVPSVPLSGDAAELLEAETARLARLLSTHAPQDGAYSPISGLQIVRFSRTDTRHVKTFRLPSLGIAAQGAVDVTVGQEVYHSVRSHIHILPVALPVATQVTDASPAKPYLGVRLDFDLQRIGELALKVYPQGLPSVRHRSAGYFIGADVGILRSMTRLLECLSNPGDVELIAPLVVDEILIRLLRSPAGAQVAEMGLADSGLHRIAKAIDWLRDNFAQQVEVAELAGLVHLSASAFHKQFKSATSMSPLQYQKALRLLEARRLMLAGRVDATTACRLVGYLSDSQFSRDYSRFFGSPPKRDMKRLHGQEQPPDR